MALVAIWRIQIALAKVWPKRNPGMAPCQESPALLFQMLLYTLCSKGLAESCYFVMLTIIWFILVDYSAMGKPTTIRTA
ncbi:MAG: cytochrome b561 [Parasphingorhabdus sp.]|jgi:cytochrome b561